MADRLGAMVSSRRWEVGDSAESVSVRTKRSETVLRYRSWLGNGAWSCCTRAAPQVLCNPAPPHDATPCRLLALEGAMRVADRMLVVRRSAASDLPTLSIS